MPVDEVNLKPYRQALEALISHQTEAKMSALLGSSAANLDDPWLRENLKKLINNIHVDPYSKPVAKRLHSMIGHSVNTKAYIDELIEYIEEIIDAKESAWEVIASNYGWVQSEEE